MKRRCLHLSRHSRITDFMDRNFSVVWYFFKGVLETQKTHRALPKAGSPRSFVAW